MSGAGFGHGGPVGEILDALPLDSTFHVTDCGYDDNDRRCGCYVLPSRLQAAVDKAVAAALAEAADAIEASGAVCANAHGNRCIGAIAYRDSARIVRDRIAT